MALHGKESPCSRLTYSKCSNGVIQCHKYPQLKTGIFNLTYLKFRTNQGEWAVDKQERLQMAFKELPRKTLIYFVRMNLRSFSFDYIR